MTDETLPVFPIPEELFIVGNGFDLQCGLETKYETFLSYILETNYQHNIDNNIIDKEKPIIDQYEQKLKDRLFFIKEEIIFGTFSNQPDFEEINIWYQIFLYEKLKGEVNWSSVEDVIRNYLTDYQIIPTLVSYTLKLQEEGFSIAEEIKKNERLEETSIKSRYVLFFQLSYTLCHKALNSLSLEKSELYNQLKNVVNKKEKLTEYQIAELITSILLNELTELEYDFECFIRYRESVTQNYYENANRLLGRMLNPEAYGHTSVEPAPYHLLSFNYTSVWSEYPNIKYSPKKYLDVHGKLPKENIRYSNIIFGIDHEGIEATALEYRFTKTYRTLKLYSRNFDGVGDDRDIYLPIIKRIKFYGHSLAEADYAYFQQIFDYYDLYSKNLELIFYYSVYDDGIAEQIEQNQMLAISRLIEKYGQTLDNKDHGKNLLTRLIQTNRLKLIRL